MSQKQHVIIIGAGVAGLLSAHVASRHFHKVTIVDKDSFCTEVAPRKGVPQSVHLHVLLQRGFSILEEFFPGIIEKLQKNGAVAMDWAQDSKWMNPFGWVPRFPSEVLTYTCSRWMLEHTIRQEVFSIPNIQVMANSKWQDFMIEGNRVSGIQLQSGMGSEKIEADLVIDASGKNSRAIKMLEKYGYTPPSESTISSQLGYASRHYEIPEDKQRSWKQLYIQMKPPQCFRGGVLQPIEGNRWIATLIGGNKDYPPGEEQAFLKFASSLRSSEFFDAISSAKPASQIFCYRNTKSRLRHFHKMKKKPLGFISIGDSVCAFNPVYGQGMTVSAISAKVLDFCFKHHAHNQRQFVKSFYKKISKVNFAPWLIASSEDRRIIAHTTKTNWHTKRIHSFLDRVLYTATQKPEVHHSFLQILHMSQPLSSLAKIQTLLLLRNQK